MAGGWWVWRFLAAGALIVLGAYTAPPAPVHASMGLRLRPVPRSLTVDPNAWGRSEIIVTNREARAIRDLRLQVQADGDLRRRVAPRQPVALGPGASMAWHIALSPSHPLTAGERVWAFAHFRRRSGRTGISATSIGVRPAPGLRVGKVASLRVHPVSSILESGKKTSIYLTVRNKSAEPLLIEGVDVRKPDFIEVRGQDRKVTVLPGRVGTVELEVSASERVSPGDWELVFVVPVRSGNGKRVDLSGSEKLRVGVAGETALLTALGVPSLLLIPGFLFLATFMLLWRVGILRPAWDDSGFELGPTSAEFWVVAIGASIVILPAARLLGTDLFESYGIEDLVRLWFGSFLLGALAYLGVVGIRRFEHRRRVLAEGDGPIEVLRKLSRARLGLSRPRARCSVGGDDVTLYVLEREESGHSETWMAPAIVCSVPGEGEDNDLVRQLRTKVDQGAGGRALARLIAQGKRRGQLEVRWSPEGRSVEGPRRISDSEVQDRLTAAPLVEVEA